MHPNAFSCVLGELLGWSFDLRSRCVQVVLPRLQEPNHVFFIHAGQVTVSADINDKSSLTAALPETDEPDEIECVVRGGKQSQHIKHRRVPLERALAVLSAGDVYEPGHLMPHISRSESPTRMRDPCMLMTT